MSAPPSTNEVPRNLRFSPDDIKRAQEKQYFITIDSSKTGKSASGRYITGAPRMWNDHPQNIYIEEVRLTGTPEDVSEALSLAGYSRSEISRLIKSAITMSNYRTSMAGDYDRLVREKEAAASSKKKKAPVSRYTREHIVWMAANLKNPDVTISVGGKQPRASKKTSTGKGRGKSLREKFDNLSADQLVDVSSMDTTTGMGATPVTLKTHTGAKKWSEGLAIASNDINKYRRAIEILFGTEGLSTYAGQIADVEGQFAGGVPRNSFPEAKSSRKSTRSGSGFGSTTNF